MTTQVISRFGLSRRRGSRAGEHKHCDWPKFTACLTDRAKVDDVIRGIPVVVGYRSTRYLEPGVQYQGRRDARTTTVKTVARCSNRSVVQLGLFNARSVGEKSAAVQQWITDMKLSLAALIETCRSATESSSSCAASSTPSTTVAARRT